MREINVTVSCSFSSNKVFCIFGSTDSDVSSTISIFTTSGVVLNYPGFLQRLPDAFTLPLSCILTARFLLHLREWQAAGEGGGSLHLSTALKFRTASASASHATVLSGIMSVDIDDFGSDPLAGTAADGEKAIEVQLASDNGSFTKEAGPVGNGCDYDYSLHNTAGGLV
ncbi:hypothetical protein GGX14DRAFT_460958 [Mycena pura]|uniref:Uncharacterized protein n=1 Tax=Mycena pura TaxID=153505 RepID=A0AAD6Y9Q7_9AGAR|nr:hypothetical protein GGX14DRAFT_460958 [Mycena pura]